MKQFLDLHPYQTLNSFILFDKVVYLTLYKKNSSFFKNHPHISRSCGTKIEASGWTMISRTASLETTSTCQTSHHCGQGALVKANRRSPKMS